MDICSVHFTLEFNTHCFPQEKSYLVWVNNMSLFWEGSKITADSDNSHETKRHLLLGRKAMINLDNILKSGDITLPIKVHLGKAMVFPRVIVQM